MRRTPLNRAFILVYSCATVALFYHHFHSPISFFSFPLVVADAIFAFTRATTECLRLRPVRHQEFPEKLRKAVLEVERDYNPPSVDVFICTADPYKEPPIGVVNTALSVLGYEYPAEKLAVYVSDDGGSQLTLFAFMEAAKFARHWLPFCRDYGLLDRSPEVYLRSGSSSSTHASPKEVHKIKMMYEEMEAKLDKAMKRGYVPPEYVMNEHEHEAFNKWTPEFTRHDHSAVIQVLLESGKDEDVKGHRMPNLVYVSREKNRISPHHFKAGALNSLLRVSATMTNAQLVLTLDCDTYSNDPGTLLRMLCYFADPVVGPKLAFVQFPQRFHSIGKNDIYANEQRHFYQMDPPGMDGLGGTRYIGSGSFFQRRAFFEGPSSSSSSSSDISPELNKSISSRTVLASAHHVANCNYEHGTKWGTEMGFRYGSLTEDFKTGYLQHCKRWKSVFCHPKREAFLGSSPFILNDVLSQSMRWSIGLLEVAISKYSPITYGTRAMGLLMGLAYAHNGFEGAWCLPITTYAYIPQLALLNGVSLFPKVSDPLFYLFAFLFLGAYVQDFLEFILSGGTTLKWWNDQRMWMIKGNTSHLFAFATYLLKLLGFPASGFNVTSKVVTEEQRMRYEQNIFEFGVDSTFFVPLTTTAVLNLIAFVVGLAGVLRHGNAGEMFVQLFISGFAMVNCWPIYEAIALRKDDGKMPAKITMMSILLAWVLYLASLLVLTL